MSDFEEKARKLVRATAEYEELSRELGEEKSKTKRARLTMERTEREYRKALFGYDIPRAPQDLMRVI